MDMDTVHMIADYAKNLNLFPYAEIAHAALICAYIKDDLRAQKQHSFAKTNPFSCYISTIFTILSGAFLGSFLLGQPIVFILQENVFLILSTITWYVVFYSPFDLGFRLVTWLPVTVALSVLQEMFRVRNLLMGVELALNQYPGAYLIAVVIGVCYGNGGMYTTVFERYFRGIWNTSRVEFVTPSFGTKAAILSSIIFIMEKETSLIPLPHNLIFLGILSLFVFFRLSAMLVSIESPFGPFETVLCAVLFGEPNEPPQKQSNGNKANGAASNNKRNGTKKQHSNGTKQAANGKPANKANGELEASKKKD